MGGASTIVVDEVGMMSLELEVMVVVDEYQSVNGVVDRVPRSQSLVDARRDELFGKVRAGDGQHSYSNFRRSH